MIATLACVGFSFSWCYKIPLVPRPDVATHSFVSLVLGIINMYIHCLLLRATAQLLRSIV